MPNKKKQPTCLNEFLLNEVDEEYINWLEDLEDDTPSGRRRKNSIDDEWARAMADLEELGFNDEIE